jgi:hypothetical protein
LPFEIALNAFSSSVLEERLSRLQIRWMNEQIKVLLLVSINRTEEESLTLG